MSKESRRTEELDTQARWQIIKTSKMGQDFD